MLYVKAINQYNNVFLFLPPVTCLGFSSTFCTFLGLYSYATCPEKSILNYTLLLLYLPFLCFIFLHSTDKEKEKKERKKSEVAQLCPTLCDPMDTRLLRPWDFLGKSTGVGCRFLLQGTSQPRDRTQVSHIVERRFLSEPPLDLSQKAKKPLNIQDLFP